MTRPTINTIIRALSLALESEVTIVRRTERGALDSTCSTSNTAQAGHDQAQAGGETTAAADAFAQLQAEA
jgi:hypothetical protein